MVEKILNRLTHHSTQLIIFWDWKGGNAAFSKADKIMKVKGKGLLGNILNFDYISLEKIKHHLRELIFVKI